MSDIRLTLPTIATSLLVIACAGLASADESGGHTEARPSVCAGGDSGSASRASVAGALRLATARCERAVSAIEAFHSCVRTSSDEASCRGEGLRVLPDTIHRTLSDGSPLSTGRIERTTGGGSPTIVATEAALRDAWSDPLETSIRLVADIFLRSCRSGGPIRESVRPLVLDGDGHTIRQTCFEKRILRQDATGLLLVKNVVLTRGGNDGPGAAITTRGEIVVADSIVMQNLAEEPGGAIFSQRRATIVRSVFTGNFAWDDGGAVYARRGGVDVFDSVFSNNLVDGSGGAIGSTGDILLVRSSADGNTTDGDGGALYADEDGDVTVVDSTVDGNTADGPGGAIFTLDGDVTVVNSTLNGNRADDRGGAIAGEADVVIVSSTIARNAAVAHVGGGVWARGDIFVTNSTISDNYAEGQGGGLLAAGRVGLTYSTVLGNAAPVAANVGGTELRAFGSVIGPTTTVPGGGIQPIGSDCRIHTARSLGFNAVSDSSCGLGSGKELSTAGLTFIGSLRDNGGFGETRAPLGGSVLIDRIPPGRCRSVPFGSVLEGEQHLSAFGIDVTAPVVADQRGRTRPQGMRCDVGSVEVDG